MNVFLNPVVSQCQCSHSCQRSHLCVLKFSGPPYHPVVWNVKYYVFSMWRVSRRRGKYSTSCTKVTYKTSAIGPQAAVVLRQGKKSMPSNSSTKSCVALMFIVVFIILLHNV